MIQSVNETTQKIFNGFLVNCYERHTTYEERYVVQIMLEESCNHLSNAKDLGKILQVFSDKIMALEFVQEEIEKHKEETSAVMQKLLESEKRCSELEKYKTYYELHKEMKHGEGMNKV